MDLEYQYLVARLQEAFARDQRLSSLDIKVIHTGGRLHLIGDVPTEQRRDAADEIARHTAPGVQIRNELRVLALGEAPPGPEAIE
jgi:osmotically-inducible protein OsmY